MDQFHSTHARGPNWKAQSPCRDVKIFSIFIVPHLEGKEVFGSQRRKANMALGCEYDSHRPDKVNFSLPRV